MPNQQIEPLALGVMTSLRGDPFTAFRKVRELGFATCQLGNPPDEYVYGPQARELTERVRAAVAETGVVVTSVFIMFKGHVWDLVDGPQTIGLVPEETRGERVVHACRISEWAKEVGIDAVTSHIGFIPEDPDDPRYPSFLRMMIAFCRYCRDNGQTFAFETGQETAGTLTRVLDHIGLDSVGINLDPANLILYGKDRPMEVVDLIAGRVFNTHCKDGVWPEPGGKLGREVALGEGEVHIRELIPALYRRGYRGPLTIEREISGERQVQDILRAKALLEEIRAELLHEGEVPRP
jgi:L-ribulose-5-phosphate 3-epimerase